MELNGWLCHLIIPLLAQFIWFCFGLNICIFGLYSTTPFWALCGAQVLPFFFLADVMYMCKEHEDISKMGEQLTALAFDLREMYFFKSKYYVL